MLKNTGSWQEWLMVKKMIASSQKRSDHSASTDDDSHKSAASERDFVNLRLLVQSNYCLYWKPWINFEQEIYFLAMVNSQVYYLQNPYAID